MTTTTLLIIVVGGIATLFADRLNDMTNEYFEKKFG